MGAGGLLAPLVPASVPAGSVPRGVAVSADGKSVYVANYGGGSVSQYDVAAGGVLQPKSPPTAPAGRSPIAVAVSPDGKSVYVTNQGGAVAAGTVSQFDVSAGGALQPKSPPTVPAGTFPIGVAVSPDGKSVYVTNQGGAVAAGTVSQFDVSAGGALQPKSPPTVPAGEQPDAVAVSPLPRLPTSKDQCKHGGWRNYSGRFKNQGDCIRFVQHQARQACLTERHTPGRTEFRNKYGRHHHRHALRRCIELATD